MAKIHSQERVIEYSKEFKTKVAELTVKLDVKAMDVAEVLGLHPVMVYRWRQEYREGKLDYEPSRMISMTKKESNPAITDEQLAELKELKELRKKNARMEKEIEVLKKWQGYLKELKEKDSSS